MNASFRKLLSVLCTFALALSLTPGAALADELTSADDATTADAPDAREGEGASEALPVALSSTDDGAGDEEGGDGAEIALDAEADGADDGEEAALDAEDVPEAENVTLLETAVDTPAPTLISRVMSFFSGSYPKVQTTSGNHVKWVDRIDFSASDDAGIKSVRQFYDVLAEAVDGDGVKDYLIDDRYVDLSEATGSDGWATPLDTLAAAGSVRVGDLASISRFPCIVAAVSDQEDSPEQRALTQAYISETYGAFDRDHPRAFWRSRAFDAVDAWQVVDGKTYYGFVMVAGKDSLILRSAEYLGTVDGKSGAERIHDDLDLYDQRLDELTDGAAAQGSTAYGQLRYFNERLVSDNSYNSNLNWCESNNYMYGWGALSALEGNKAGDARPVCEGYSRAMQALCLKAGIPCVLVDGPSDRGPHMWNNVQVDGAWYAIDCTWNSPGALETYFLHGADTEVGGRTFAQSHTANNQFLAAVDHSQAGAAPFDPATFAANAPQLAADAYVHATDKSDPVAVAPAGVTAIYGDRLADVELRNPASNTPGSWAWSSPSDLVGSAGNRSHVAVFTPDDPQAFHGVTTSVAVEVSPKSVTPVVTVEGGPFTYTGQPITPSVAVTAEGTPLAFGTDYTVTYANNVDAGTASATAHAVANGNYAFADNTAAFAIGKKEGWLRFSTTITSNPKVTIGTPLALSMAGGEGTMAMRFELTRGSDIASIVDSTGKPSVKATAPGAITVRAECDGNGNYAAASATCDLTAVAPPFKAPEGLTALPTLDERYRVAGIGGLSSDSISKLTLANTLFTDQSSIAMELVRATGLVMPTVKADQTAVYDLKLYTLTADGEWLEADASSFPAEGVEVDMGFPQKGLNGTDYRFAAAHMFTEAVNGYEAGQVETPDVTVDSGGVRFRVMGLSPVSVSWEEVSPQQAIYNRVANTTTTGQPANGNLAQTGDRLPVVPLVAVVIVAGAALVFLLARRRKKD